MKLINKISNLIRDIFERGLVINAYVIYDGKRNKIKHENWGDDFNYYFSNLIFKKKFIKYFGSYYNQKINRKNYIFIGSTINFLTTKNSIIWGAGIISDEIPLRDKPRKIYAVRGPLTRNFILSQNISCPEIYGDPVLLLPYYYKPKKLKNKIGIVPHYSKLESNILNSILSKNKNIKKIDLKNYVNWEDVVDEITSCEVVLSSSLHGLVIAEAYGVKNIWVKWGENLIGNNFKFNDFFYSINKPEVTPIVLNEDSNINKLVENYEWKLGEINLDLLIESCPIKIKMKKKYEHPLDLR